MRNGILWAAFVGEDGPQSIDLIDIWYGVGRGPSSMLIQSAICKIFSGTQTNQLGLLPPEMPPVQGKRKFGNHECKHG